MDAVLRALNRFGLGARPGERRRTGDYRGWLRGQLDGGAPILTGPAESTPDRVAAAIQAFRPPAQRAAVSLEERQAARRNLIAIGSADALATVGERVRSERPFVERLVAFWTNHLCVSTAGKIVVNALAGAYEREAIRPHVLGSFEDMVLASAMHPAMLAYLDNAQSVGPRSQGAAIGRGRGRGGRGLNENYARELLELHTLGVNGGYTQQDVQELAKILTGWTVRGPMAFTFAPLLHEPGVKTLLGVRYGDGRDAGIREGQEAIRALCRHPSTARFVATKLVTHFVADAPPAAAVDSIARVFRETQGDLRRVAAALIEVPDVWTTDARKFRTPQDWLVAVLRASDAPADVMRAGLPVQLRQLRHPIWAPPSPKGFGDLTSDWADPDSLLNRAELARTLGRRLRQNRVDPRMLLDTVDTGGADALTSLVGDTAIAADERIALVLASPAFGWR